LKNDAGNAMQLKYITLGGGGGGGGGE